MGTLYTQNTSHTHRNVSEDKTKDTDVATALGTAAHIHHLYIHCSFMSGKSDLSGKLKPGKLGTEILYGHQEECESGFSPPFGVW